MAELLINLLTDRIVRSALDRARQIADLDSLKPEVLAELAAAAQDLAELTLKRASLPAPARIREIKILAETGDEKAIATVVEVERIEQALLELEAIMANWKFVGALTARRAILAGVAHATNMLAEAAGAFVTRLIQGPPK